MVQDSDMVKLASEEKASYLNQLETLESELANAILENVSTENCNDIVLEISAGVGGQESMLFVKDLMDMYIAHLDYLGFTYDILEVENADQGNYRSWNVANLFVNTKCLSLTVEKQKFESGFLIFNVPP